MSEDNAPDEGSQKHARLFSTEHLKSDLKGRAVNSTVVTYFAQAINFAATTLSTVVLARLLMPADFGLVALATAVVGLISIFSDMGLSAATVQREKITHQQVSNLFWINAGTGLFLSLLALAASPMLASVFGEPRLQLVIVAYSALFPITALAAQHSALLQRRMEFKALAIRNVAANGISVTAGIALALAGFGYWALVWASMLSSLSGALFIWMASPWRPGLPRNMRDTRGMIGFGLHSTAARLFAYASTKSDAFIIGGALGTVSLGLYSKANALLFLPVRNLNNPLGGTAVPALAAIKTEPERYRRFYRNAINYVSILSTPVVVFSYFFAHEIVLVVLGPQWGEAAAIYKYLCPAALTACTSVATGWIYRSWGHVDRQTKSTFVNGALQALAIWLGSQWGVYGVAIAISAFKVASKIPSLAYCYAPTPIKVADFCSAIWRPLVHALIAAAPSILLSRLLSDQPVALATGASLAVFGVTYAVLVSIFHGPFEPPLRLGKELIWKRIAKRRLGRNKRGAALTND